MRDALHEIVEEFAETPKDLRLPLLLEFANGLPPLPERLIDDRDAMEPVEECTAPLFLAVDVTPGEPVRLYFDAPPSQETRPVGRPLLFSRVRRPLPGRVSPEISLLLKQNRKIRFKTFI